MNIEIEPLMEFENQLMDSLKPVAPNARFVDHLRTRLVTPPLTVYEPEPDAEQVISHLGLALATLAIGLTIGLSLLRLRRILWSG